MNALKKVRARLRSWSQVRFLEPVVIFESDDWGLWRSPEDKTILESIGEPKIWGYDQLESVAELEAFYSVFEDFRDQKGNHPFAEANFVVSNPDFTATSSKSYREIVLKPIASDPERISKWKEGIQRKVFLPQYHGRLHFNYQRMLSAIHADPVSRKIFDAGIHGGMNNYTEGKWGLHSEYLDWHSGSVPENIREWTHHGFDEFEKSFGYRAKSTVAPQYIFTPGMAGVFRDAGVSCIQGTNMQMYKSPDGREHKLNLPNGSGHYSALTGISRNVKFEPARGVPSWNADVALKNAKRLIALNIPVIIDSHRINYTGRFAAEGRRQLRQLLEGLQMFNVRYLASFELAEAVTSDGHYTEFFTGKKEFLTPVGENSFKKWFRDRIVKA